MACQADALDQDGGATCGSTEACVSRGTLCVHASCGMGAPQCFEHFTSLVVGVVITREQGENRTHVFGAPMLAAYRAYSSRLSADSASTGRIRFQLIYVAGHAGPGATEMNANGGRLSKQGWVKGGM